MSDDGPSLAPVITRFVVKPTGALSHALELAWELVGDDPAPARQRYLVEVRPSEASAAWTRVTVRTARVVRIAASAIKRKQGAARADVYEARVAFAEGGGPITWSGSEYASALRPEAMASAAAPPRRTVAEVAPLSVDVPLAHVLDATCERGRDGIRLTASWGCRTADGRSTWAPEFEIAVTEAGADRWAIARTTQMRYAAAITSGEPSALEIKVRARLGGRDGAWSSVRSVAIRDARPPRRETAAPRPAPTRRVTGATETRALRAVEAPPEVTLLRAAAVPEGVVVTSTWQSPAAAPVDADLTFHVAIRSTRPDAEWVSSSTARRAFRAIVRDTTFEGIQFRVRAATRSRTGPWSRIVGADVSGRRRPALGTDATATQGPGSKTPETPETPETPVTPEELNAQRAALHAAVLALQRKLSARAEANGLLPAHDASLAPSAQADESVPRTRRERRVLRDGSDARPDARGEVLEVAAIGEMVQRLSARVAALVDEVAQERVRRRALEKDLERALTRVGLLETVVDRDHPSVRTPAQPMDAGGVPISDSPNLEDVTLEPDEGALALARTLIDSPLYMDRMAKAGRAAPDPEAARAFLESLAVRNFARMSDLAEAAGLAPNQIRPLVAVLRRLLNIDGYDVLRTVGDRVAMDWALATEQFELTVDSAHRDLLP